MAHDRTNLIRVKRRLSAKPERVFDAWLDPRLAGRWLFITPESEAHKTEIDARVGGKWTITDRRGGTDYAALGEYLEIDRPCSIVFTFGMPQFSPGFDKVIVEIAPDGDGSILTLTQIGLPPGVEKPLIEGWEKMFDALRTALGGSA